MFLLGVELAVSRVLHGFTVSPTMTPVQTKKNTTLEVSGSAPCVEQRDRTQPSIFQPGALFGVLEAAWTA